MNVIAEPGVSLELSRTLQAPRREVYEAWTDTALAQQWWGPEGCETLELLAEPRAGGKFRWLLKSAEGERMTARGEFLEIQPNQKLIFTWSWDDPQWEGHDSVVTVEFADARAGACELRLKHEGLPGDDSRANHEEGWTGALDKLERMLARPAGGP